MTSSGIRRGSAAVRFLGGTALATAAACILAGCSPSMPTAQTSMPVVHDQAPSTSPTLASAPTETGLADGTTPVYYLGAHPRNVFLYREFRRDLPDTGDPISTAVKAMTSTAPNDPDYFSPWTPASKIGTSISSRNVITVDISADAFKTQLDEGMAHRAVQQLVYTATAAAASSGLVTSGRPSSVVILVDGKAGYKAFGHVELGGEMTRDATVAAPIWVIEPHEDAALEGALNVTGSGVAEDSTLHWTVTRLEETGQPAATASPPGTGAPAEASDVVGSGSVQLDSHAGETGQFRFSLPLAPGSYELRVFHAGQEAASTGPGEAEELNIDSKTFTIR